MRMHHILVVAIAGTLLISCGGGGGGNAPGRDVTYPLSPHGTVTRSTTTPWQWIRDDPSLPAGCGVQDNRWNEVHAAPGDHAQRVFVETLSGEPAFGWQWLWPQSPEVVTYPEVICGTKPWDMGASAYTLGESFPFQPSTHTLRVGYDLALESTGQHNVAFSLWAVSDSAHPLATVTNEIMVWIDGYPEMNPAGSRIDTAVSGDTAFDVWVNPGQVDHSGSSSATWTFAAFVPQQPLLSGALDLTPLLDYLRTHDIPGSPGQKMLPADAWIGDLELGTEIVSGDGVVEVTGFSVQRGDR